MQNERLNNEEREHGRELVSLLEPLNAVAVALSGGVDSAVVAKAAQLACGHQAVAVTAVSPSLASSELQDARNVAALIGIRHVEIATDEFARPEYQANAGDRCFYCKDTLYTLTNSRLQELGVNVLLNGANCDDLGDHRPGMRAADHHNVRSPLIEAGMNKQDVRELARRWKLPIADKPASPCLSSRIAYGVEVTPERVRRVEAAEVFLKSLLSTEVLRVRMESGDLARLELRLEDLGEVFKGDRRQVITTKLHELGFRRVTLDLDGFRSGSMNDSLDLVELKTL